MSNIFKNTIILIISLFMINSSFANATPLSNETIKSSLVVNNLTDNFEYPCIKYICTASAANEELKNAGFTCKAKTAYESYSVLELVVFALISLIPFGVGLCCRCCCLQQGCCKI